MLNHSYSSLIENLSATIARAEIAHPLRVAIDGRTAAGKTTFAGELAAALTAAGRPVIQTSIDGFHRPKAERYARGRRSPEGYYHDARDLDAVKRLLLAPLGPDGDRLYRTASFDLENDKPIDQTPTRAPADAILLVDGTFLQRPELSDDWDFVIFIDVSAEISLARGVARDQDMLGGTEDALSLYKERYLPAFSLYEQACNPHKGANVVIDNRDWTRPKAVFRT